MTLSLPILAEQRQRTDLSRIHLLHRGDLLLVMDRISGRWLYLPRDYEETLRLLGADDLGALPTSLRQDVQSLRQMLSDRQIGQTGSERRFDQLNTLIIKLTNACNLACAYCYDFEKEDTARRLDAEVARRALRQAVDLCEGRLQIIFHGGEPMLAWELIEQIVFEGEALADARGVEITFVGQSNMTRVTDRVVQFSDEHDIRWGVSVDGTPAVHDRFRILHNGGGSHDLFLQTLRRYPQFIRRCGVMTTITRATAHLLLETARYFRDLGLTSWDWSLFQPIGRGRDSCQFEFDVERLLASWNQLFDGVLGGEFDGFHVRPVTKYVDNFFNGPGANMCMRGECGAARDLLSISVDGTIEACDCIDPKGPMGNLGSLHAGTLVDARISPTAERIRSRTLEHLRCGECIWYGVCGGTCMAHAGDVDKIWDDACAVALCAFDRISHEAVASQRLARYRKSLRHDAT